MVDATPAWLPVLWVAAGTALFLAALWQMLRKAELIALCCSFRRLGLDLAGIWAVQSILEASTGVVITPNPIVRGAGGCLVTLLTGLLLYSGG